MCFTYLVLTALLQVAPAESHWVQFLKQYKELRPNDDAACLELAGWCDQRMLVGGAKQCYENVLKRKPDGEARQAWCEAAFRLAKIEIAAKRYERARGLLEDLLKTCKHEARKCFREQARELFEGTQNTQTREQLRHFEKGEQNVAKRQWELARQAFEKAFKLLPTGAIDAAYIPSDTILRRIAECRRQLDESFAAKKVKRERSSMSCSSCAGTGFVGCETCKSTGKGKPSGVVLGGRGNNKPKAPDCGSCKGWGYHSCTECYGLGARSGGITSIEKESLRKVINKLTNLTTFNGPLKEALDQVAAAVLSDVKDGATLSYLRSIKERYALSRELRAALGSVPRSSTDKASPLWDKTKNDKTKDGRKGLQAKINFLLGYACELSDYIDKFDMLRLPGSKKPDFSFAAWESLLLGEPVSPELIAAFPDETRNDWTAVQGILESYVQAGEKGIVKLRESNDVQFFVWTPEAQDDLQELARGQWSAFIGGLPERYPFDLASKLANDERTKKDHVIRLAGRFLRNRLGSPRNWFEVWHFEIGLSRTQEQARIALARPVDDLRLSPAIPVAQVARFLRDWRDLEIGFDGVSDETPVEFTATGCPIGLLLDEIARSGLEADWYYQAGKVVFCRRAPAGPARDLKAVLRELRKLSRGELQVQRGTAAEAPGVARLPEDPAGLRVVLRQSLETMQYDAAERCLEELKDQDKGEARAQAIARLGDTARIFHELTVRTPVSKLVGAPDLAQITYRKETSGDVVPPVLVKVVNRKGSPWRVQEAYGIEFTIDPVQFTKEPRLISGQEWRILKEKRLEQLEKDLTDASPESKASQLFILAIFAKTHGFPGKGTAYLKQAMSFDAFEELLKLHLPERFDEMSRLWRRASGREALPPVEDPRPRREVAVPEAPTQEPKPIPSGLPSDELLAKAKEYVELGNACYRKTLEGQGAQEWNKRARGHFEEAEEALRSYLEGRPDDAAAARLMRDIRQVRSDLHRGIGFFD